jgi:electron transport complex protein RnfG
MKTESNVRYIIRITLTLLLIATIVAAALALVNNITAPIIAQVNAQKTQQAIELVLPGGYDAEVTDYADETGLVSKVYKGENGYAVEVTPGGFDSTITMMVGVDPAGKVLGISIISHTESAGLGAVAAASNSAGQAFRDQFVGLSGSVAVGDNIDAITNATITSRAVCDGVNAALACVRALEGGAA